MNSTFLPSPNFQKLPVTTPLHFGATASPVPRAIQPGQNQHPHPTASSGDTVSIRFGQQVKNLATSPGKVDLVRDYLKEIGRIPLLIREQEIKLGTAVRKGIAAETLLAGEAAVQEALNEDKPDPYLLPLKAENLSESSLQQLAVQGKRAKSKMIKANLRLVVSVAKKYQNRNLELLDLLQEGNLGLDRAVDKFDPAKGYKFSTYAYWWIRQSITRAIAHQGRTIRLPIHITEKLNKIKKVQRELSQTLGRTATVREVADHSELTPKQVREYLEISRKPVSLDKYANPGDPDISIGDLIPDNGLSTMEAATQTSLKEDLNGLLAHLTDQERQVIELRYGLKDNKTLTLAQVGKKLDLSRERVRQIQEKALNHLRGRTRGQNLAEYIR